ncbi:hypothetical protein [Methanoculleus sp. 7T]|uniref:hypothetical protein n=1 Tax=Methanoculleus sp. 7T TaxID=2937282 RepID=UPI0020BD6132|nr:hypothetical protein [Methanoculleus sp. 7T]MCK8518412.1 hypothetical protein [Methanoculleus sp. 7T]
MRLISILLFTLMSLVFVSGCIDSQEINPTENTTLAPFLYYERGNISTPLNISELPVRNSTANVTGVIETLLADQRTGILLENGWKITSVSGAVDRDSPNRRYTDVEFEKEGLSYFIEVDETANRTLEGHSGAKLRARPSDSPPEDYYKWKWFDEDSSVMYGVFDRKNDRAVMIYNKTTIFYLYPSYAIIDTEGLNDD